MMWVALFCTLQTQSKLDLAVVPHAVMPYSSTGLTTTLLCKPGDIKLCSSARWPKEMPDIPQHRLADVADGTTSGHRGLLCLYWKLLFFPQFSSAHQSVCKVWWSVGFCQCVPECIFCLHLLHFCWNMLWWLSVCHLMTVGFVAISVSAGACLCSLLAMKSNWPSVSCLSFWICHWHVACTDL